MGFSLGDLSPANWLASASGDPNGLGDILSGGAVSNAQSVAATNAANTANAQAVMNYNTQMSDTSYQRGVQDMKAAGLNPMLAYSQGGDSTPTGVSPQLQAPQTGDIGAGIGNTIKSAATGNFDVAANNRADVAQNNATDTAVANNKATAAQTEYTDMNTQRAEVGLTGDMKKNDILDEQKKQAKEASKQMKLKTQSSAMDTDLQKERFPVDKKLQKFDSWDERAHAVSGTISNAVSAFTKGAGAMRPDTDAAAIKAATKRGYNAGRLDSR